ncbi:hypothetical protein FGO68_gene8986 [Halteria grandinella]|uniref:Uncharacterized protein n=1 Tax=Halteria grandinella TaxID=5974 RepID=A0A8J8T9J1_HALGN|nr:hypothetical protein FGO68_gene8986 [Halteria grandinella]
MYTLTDPIGRNMVKQECGMVILIIVCFTVGMNVIKVIIQAAVLLFKAKRIARKPTKEKVVKLKPIAIQSRVVSFTTNTSVIDDQSIENSLWHDYHKAKIVKTASTSNATMHSLNLVGKEMCY